MKYILKVSVILAIILSDSLTKKLTAKEHYQNSYSIQEESFSSIYYDFAHTKLFNPNLKIAKQDHLKYFTKNDSQKIKQRLGKQNLIIDIENGVIFTLSDNDSFNETGILKKKPKIMAIANDQRLPKRYREFNMGSVTEIDLPLQEINSVGLGEEITLNLPNGSYRFIHDNSFIHADNNTWVGYLTDEGKNYRIYISQGRIGVFGQIIMPSGEYHIENTEGKNYFIDISAANLKTKSFESDILKKKDGVILANSKPYKKLKILERALNNAKVNYLKADKVFKSLKYASGQESSKKNYLKTNIAIQKKNKAFDILNIKKNDYNNFFNKVYPLPVSPTKMAPELYSGYRIIDVAVIYTKKSLPASLLKQEIQYVIDINNQAYMDSGVNAQLRLIHTDQVDYSEINDNIMALKDLQQNKIINIEDIRDRYSADIVVLYRPYHPKFVSSCGSAEIGYLNLNQDREGPGFLSVVSSIYSPDSGNEKDYCLSHTLAHEIGHNLGNVHDREYTRYPGKFTYSYAYGVDGLFGTIMSYKQPAIPLFSSPYLKDQCAGSICGYPEGNEFESDQVLSMNSSIDDIASLKP